LVCAYLLADGNVFCYTRLEPVGVVGAIVPVSMLIDSCIMFAYNSVI